MIQLRIRIPGREDTLLTVEGDEAVIGRSSDCQAPVALQYVSKRHAKILTGVVLADLGSRNGVWIDGRKIEEPCLLEGSSFRLGDDDEKSPVIEVVQAAAANSNEGPLTSLREENQQLASRVADLEEQLASRQSIASRESKAASSRAASEDDDPLRTSASVKSSAGYVPAPQPEPRAGATPPRGIKIPTFEEFFGAAKPQPAPVISPAARSPARGNRSAPAVPAVVPGSSREEQRQRIVGMINRLIAEDVGNRAPMIEGPVDEFFTLESFRLLRKVEQVITYLARDMVQLLDIKTYLPSAEGNFRSLAADVLADEGDRHARQRLVEYLEDLRKWLGVSLTAHRQAAQQFVRDLKKELSAEALTASEPLSIWKKVIGRTDAELWRRVQVHLRELSDDIAEERLEQQAKRIATELLEAPGK